MQVGKRGGERSDTRGRDLSARDSIHGTTLGSIPIANRLIRQEMSRTPSCTMHYFYPTGQLARTSFVRAKPARRIQAGSHKPQNSFRCQCPRRFWEVDPEILHTCLVCPCRAFNECIFLFSVFFVRYLGFCFFLGYLGIKRPHIFGEKNKKNKRQNIRKGSARAH